MNDLIRKVKRCAMELTDKEVYFHEWCPKCKHWKKAENEDPCWDCLSESMNVESHKPLYFKEGQNVKKSHGVDPKASR